MNERRAGRPPHDDVLTPAEWRVAELVRHGLSNPRIALLMGVSTDAVKFHVGNALGKLGLSSRRELRIWNGVAKGSAMHLRRNAMNAHTDLDYMMLGQVARSVANAEESRCWYRDVLGLPELYSFGNLAFFDLGGVRLMLAEADGDGKPSESILYLRVPDIHSTQEQLESRGVKFTHAPHMVHRHEDGTEEWMAFFEDNEGRPLGIMTQMRTQVR